MKKKRIIVLCTVVAAIIFIPSMVYAQVGGVNIQHVAAKQRTPSKYVLTAELVNDSGEDKEVILRGQITFYDKAAPKGDLPVTSVRKDVSVVLRKYETRNFETLLIIEGTPPVGSLRMEPSLRIRRSREWNY
ncbi:MAG: hypothetical protein JW893_09590 [Candidatus Omnitrophica bacterium]|nr:hypothetical protein [Candidatus Omnitrophota bacterium]